MFKKLLETEENEKFNFVSGLQSLDELMRIETSSLEDHQAMLKIDENLFSLSNISFKKNHDEENQAYIKRLEDRKRELEDEIKSIAWLQYQVTEFKKNLINKKIFPDISSKQLFEESTQKYNQIVDKLKSLEKELTQSIDKVNASIIEAKGRTETKKNSITLRIFYPPKERQKETLGVPTSGHLSLEIYTKDGRRQYISFYPGKKTIEENSALENITKTLGIPTMKKFEGTFQTQKEDDKLLLDGEYDTCKEVVIECDNLEFLDIEAAYNWANMLLLNPTSYFQAYTHNCSTICLEGLKVAGSEHLVPIQQHLIGIDFPQRIYNYASSIQEELQLKILNNVVLDGEKSNLLQVAIQDTKSKIDAIILISNKPENKEFIEIATKISKKLQAKLALHKVDNDFYTEIDQLSKEFQLASDVLIENARNKCIEYEKNKSNGIVKKKIDDEYQSTIQSIDGVLNSFSRILKLIPVNAKSIIVPITEVLKTSLYQSAKTALSLKEISKTQTEEISKVIDLINKHIFMQNKEPDQIINLFRKALLIKSIILELKNNKHDPALNQFYDNVVNALNVALGEINQFLYFDKNPTNVGNIASDNLSKLRNILSINEDKRFDENHNNLNGMLKERLNLFSASNLRHSQEKTKSDLLNIFKNDKCSHSQKVSSIEKIVENQKPPFWKFWRYKERPWYDQIKKDAILTCIIDNFAKGQLDILDLAIELEKYNEKYPSTKSNDILNLAKSIKSAFNDNVSLHDTTYPQESVHMKMKKKVQTSSGQIFKALDGLGFKLEKGFEFLKQISFDDDRAITSSSKQAIPSKQEIEKTTNDFCETRKITSCAR